MSADSKADLRWLDSLNHSGFAIVEDVLSPEQIGELVEATGAYSTLGHDGVLDRRGEVYGGRDLLWRVPHVFSLAHSPTVLSRIQGILGPAAFPVRGLFFDKTLNTNWNLPWHQDLTIAVSARATCPDSGPGRARRGFPTPSPRLTCWRGW